MLNVGQHHRRRANINPASIQSIVPVPPACRYRQHKLMTRAEWILASTGDAGPTFNRHWVGFGSYLPPALCTARPAASVDKPHNVLHIAGCKDIETVDLAQRRFSYCRYKKTGSPTSKYIVSTLQRSHLSTLITKAIDTRSISYQPL